MRRLASWPAAPAIALVLGLLAAPAANADEQGQINGPSVDVLSTGDVPEASGLVVTTTRSSASIEAVATDLSAGALAVDGVATGPGSTRVIRFDEPVPGAVADRLAAELELRSGVSDAEPDYVRTAADAPPVAVDDPFFLAQRNLWDTARPGGGYSTRAPVFWQQSMGTPGVRVAVLDTGRTSHPDLSWSLGYDAVSLDSDPTDLGDFHGTHVAGTVAALAGNGRGVAGVAPGVSLVPVRVLDAEGSGSDSTIARGIRWASGSSQTGVPTNASPAQVISMSLAGPGPCTTTLASAISSARSRGVVVIAAAGNAAKDAAGYSPANCPGVITVGATNDSGARASFSNFGSTVDISAPGVGVLSTYAETSAGGQDVYARLSGTSMATPAVAGAAALLASVGMSGAQIEAALPAMVQPATSPATAGVLDLGRAPGLTSPAAAPPAPRKVSTSVSARTATSSVRKGGRAVVRVTLRAPSSVSRPTGRIRLFDGSRVVRSAYVSPGRNGRITVKTPRIKRKGLHRLRVVYSGEGVFVGSRSVVRAVRVR